MSLSNDLLQFFVIFLSRVNANSCLFLLMFRFSPFCQRIVLQNSDLI